VLWVPRVRLWNKLLGRSYYLACISEETIQHFWTESQRGGFWPGLRSLECCVAGWDTAPFISTFLNPSITHLGLRSPQESNPLLPPTLSIISHTCRQLQSFTIDVGASGSPPISEMGRLISTSGSTLRSIEVKPFTPPEIFPVIFKLPLLRSLTLEEPRLPDQIPSKILPSLEAVNLAGNRVPNLAQFFGRLSAKKLAEVKVNYSQAIQPLPLLSSLTGATATMKHIDLSRVTTLCRSSIALLRTFTNLTYLYIRCLCKPEIWSRCSSQLTDQDLLDLGGALPCIRSLHLSPQCFTQPHFTFKTLVHLSRICGSLEHLSAKVDFTSFVDGCDRLTSSNVNLGDHNSQRGRSKLRVWDVGNSPLPRVSRYGATVAVALATAFPSIKMIMNACQDPESREWGEVTRKVHTCQKVFRILQAEGERLNTGLVIPVLTRLIQTLLQFRRPAEGFSTLVVSPFANYRVRYEFFVG
jgi:hypothetical protein